MSAEPFPSLVVTEDAFVPQGSFAEAQAEYLSPDPEVVRELDQLLEAKKVGVVAHFYMDPELQGVLAACEWPHVHISDSLAMADAATKMVEAGCEHIVVLGVDFMSENARAVLDSQGHEAIPVYRVAAEPIGCSLAESAEAKAYGAYLMEAAERPRSLHVVYINTSLRTKGKAHAIVPTITCTSSNVVQTVLTAFAQIEGVEVYFGPDTYMGRNLEELFGSMAEMDDAQIREVHPAHDRASMRRVIEGFHYFRQGTCIVHHMFGADVARRVREDYDDVYVTAHLEVPGEMFEVALERQREADAGVVGSTSNILGFITRKVHEAVEAGGAQRLRFVLGTEAGMITSVVNRVRRELKSHAGSGVEAEIIFPVASEAIAEAPGSELAVVPGVSAGEGCSTAGGCATCPYMKMNSLDALLAVVRRVGVADDDLSPYFPHKYVEPIAGRTAADIGGEPILHMRAFQRDGRLPDALVEDVKTRHAERGEGVAEADGAAPRS
ncbi:MAG TPA: quinolinate synthase NadA [Sandaracinaceae bacterium LLY-WYZ-13_1]|nr:quinolinate synthase NadA [Sandaracinaceae bacterium LLY-WYZ-13_1]